MDMDARSSGATEPGREQRDRPFWAQAMADPAAFAVEQEAIGKVWNFLGYTSDIPNQNDWFRTTLGGRSIFVQHFRDGIRAFENRCAHRFYPLRTADKGNGPVVCGYHHWRYNEDGLALGVPLCVENYGKTPRELNARLPEVELGFCGPLIFGRFPGGRAVSLEEWLGPGRDILLHLAAKPGTMLRIDKKVEAHWKLIYEITLDDYHVVAIHPSTFGKNGYLPIERIRYFRFGAHSSYFPGADAEAFDKLVEECRAGGFTPQRYRIFQFFPNLIVVIVFAMNLVGDKHWYLLVQNLMPEAPGRTGSTMRYFRLPFHDKPTIWRKLLRAYFWPTVTAGVWYYIKKIQREDDVACEKLQTAVTQIDGPQRLARQEARIAWFEEEYARAMGDATLAPAPPEFETFAGDKL